VEASKPVPISSPAPVPIVRPNVVPDVSSAPAYPTSSKKKSDWSQIDKEIKEDMVKNKDEYAEGD